MATGSLFLLTGPCFTLLDVVPPRSRTETGAMIRLQVQPTRTEQRVMQPSILAILILCLLFVLLAGGMPIGFAMGLSAFLGTLLLIDGGAALALLGQTAYETALAYSLSVIPMFVLMGYIAGEAGLNESLYRACNAWLGHRRGGLALATIGACGAFAAICGSSLATAATMAQIALPEMRKYKYRRQARHRRGRGGRHHRHPDPAQRRHGDLRPCSPRPAFRRCSWRASFRDS